MEFYNMVNNLTPFIGVPLPNLNNIYHISNAHSAIKIYFLNKYKQ